MEYHIMNKKFILPIMAIAFAAIPIWGATHAYAQSTSTDSTKPFSSIVQKLVSKFGLKEADVKAVFEEERTERQAQMEAKFVANLDQAIKDGKLTDAQKQLILSKRQEMESAFKANEGKDPSTMTPTERQAQGKTQMQELKDWATKNGIDLKYLMGGGEMHKGMGMRGDKPGEPPVAE
jgi:hypothetical protein